MKTNYVAPQIEVVEIELESILCGSGNSIESTSQGSSMGNRSNAPYYDNMGSSDNSMWD